MVMVYVPRGWDSSTAFSNLSKYWRMVVDKKDENVKINSPLSPEGISA